MLIIFQEGSEKQILDEPATPEKPVEDNKNGSLLRKIRASYLFGFVFPIELSL